MMFGWSKTFYSYQVVDNHKKTMTKPEGKWAYENGCYIFREIKPCCPNSQR